MLNKEQQAVVDANEPKILCLAGAGTGKTYCMLERVKRLIADGVSPNSILVLTFTNAAANEMLTRYKASSKFYSPVCFSTFHAFCYNLLIEDRDVLYAIGYSDVPTILSENDQEMLAKQIKNVCGLKRTSKWDDKDPKQKYEHTVFDRAFNKRLRTECKITFDLLSTSVCNLFRSNHDSIKKYKDQYKYIFVDEFQDTDPTQYNFILSFYDANLFVVGDVFQSLYAFRNADSTIIRALAKSDEWTTYKLNVNYRSDIPICEYANSITKDVDEDYKIVLESDREGESVQVTPMYGLEHTITTLVPILMKQSGSTAILCRTNWEVDRVIAALDNYHIATTSSTHKDILEDVLQAWCDDDALYTQNLASYLSDAEYASYLRMKITDSEQLIQEFPKPAILRIASAVVAFKEKVAEECKLFTEESNIYVGTIHSVKGLEYDSVVVLNVGGKSFQKDTEEGRNLPHRWHP